MTINPVGVFGPVLLPINSPADVNTSNQMLMAILNKEYPGVRYISRVVSTLSLMHSFRSIRILVRQYWFCLCVCRVCLVMFVERRLFV